MTAKTFMNEYFPNLELRPALFYSWQTAIRFELGVDWSSSIRVESYAEKASKRAITLFEDFHSSNDELFVVIDVDDLHGGRNIQRQLKIFPQYVNKNLLYKLSYQELPFHFSEEEDARRMKTHRFTLCCKRDEIKYKSLLKAICHQDLGLKPSLIHRVYFLNKTRKTIFHMYDDRGCDVLATRSIDLQEIYMKRNKWILDYDREKIDLLFQ